MYSETVFTLNSKKFMQNKSLDELTTEELGRLFPIEIVPYNKQWNTLFLLEKELINNSLGEKIALKVEHFGSTAVLGLSAKPIIDILVEIPQLTEELKASIISKMDKIGYKFIWRTDDEEPYMNFVKGYTITGFEGQVFHIHMGDKNHSLWDRIFFRDYLREHPEIAKEYENLKIELAEIHKNNRETYTQAKTEFITRITEIAKQTYRPLR